MSEVVVANAIGLGFPAGTTVKMYRQNGFQPNTPVSGPPSGTEVGTAVVAANGTLTFTGLVEGTFYIAAAEVGGAWRYVQLYSQTAGEVTVIATQATGDFAVTTAGKGFRVKEGANAKMGTGTLVAGKVTIANTSVTATSRIFLQRTGATNAAGLSVTAIVAGTSFTVESSSGVDTGTFNYLIFEPA